MKHTIKHHLPHGVVRTATKKAIEVYQEKFSEYEPQAVWVNEDRADISFVALKKKLEGSIELHDEEKEITLELEVPFMLKPFQGKAMEVIEKEIKKWLGKAENGELEEESEE